MGKAKVLSTTSELPSNFWDGNQKKEMTEKCSQIHELGKHRPIQDKNGILNGSVLFLGSKSFAK
jgi:hypothetical protein